MSPTMYTITWFLAGIPGAMLGMVASILIGYISLGVLTLFIVVTLIVGWCESENGGKKPWIKW